MIASLRLVPLVVLCCAPWMRAVAADASSEAGTESCSGGYGYLTALMPLLAAADAAPPPGLKRTFQIGDDISFTAQGATGDLLNGYSVLTGDVDVHIGDRELQADQITRDNTNNTMNAVGQVRFRNPIVMVLGDAGRYTDDGAMFTHAQFQFQKQPGYGSADRFVWTPDNVIAVQNVVYTSCPPPKAVWRIRARQLKLDTARGEGVGRDARLEIEGIPVLYTPWISFPLSDARKSGFLFPEFSTSSPNGITVATPWYWNIAPNQDATITPTIYALRGVDLGVQYRHLTEIDSGTLNVNFLPDDQRQKEQDRSLVRLVDRVSLPFNSRVDVNYENVSDVQYFEDFSQGTEATSTPFLPRSVAIAHRDDVWNLRAQLSGFQTLDTVNLIEYQRPFLELPRVTIGGLWSAPVLPSLTLSFNSEVVNFTRSCDSILPPQQQPLPGIPCSAIVNPEFPVSAAVSGWRLDAKPQIGLDLSGPGYFFRPSAAWDLTQYELRNATNTDTPQPGSPIDTSPQRSLPILDLDTGLQFERMTGSSEGRSVTFEPRLMYLYIPYRKQSDLPVFDTSTPDLNTIELFRPNRFVGIDRIGDSNSLTVGATTQWFNNTSGARYLSATLAQAFYLQPPKVTAPDETLAPHTTSSLIAEVSLNNYRHWYVQVDLASSPTRNRIEQAQIMTRYLANDKQVINIGYLYRYGVLQQVDGSAAWPISRHWDIYARTVYSLFGAPPMTSIVATNFPVTTPAAHPGSIEDFAGFQYRGSCWSIRAIAQHSISTRTGQSDTGVSLQVELTGLSNVGNGVGTGSGVNTFLEQSIRGYSASSPYKPLN
ncbi:MAG TPA: LPS assembly protein LptD [Steroidobacteraceae bacterium]|nr:LPS assembly protein LptD [Steroidobacteraceae bacterium]